MDIEYITKLVIEQLKQETKQESMLIPLEASAKHVHLCKEHLELLFGEGYTLKQSRPLSQIGQFLCEERVRLIGPKGVLENVAILGPERKNSQVELSKTDCVALGVSAPLRESGDTKGSGGICISYKNKYVFLTEGVIVAKRHIHMTPEDAVRFGVKDNDIVQVKVHSERPVIFDDVLIRCNNSFVLNMHIDYDEANACFFQNGIKGEIVGEQR